MLDAYANSTRSCSAATVLVNVPAPEQIVSAAVALTKPGGTVAFHEVDWAAVICEPRCEEWTTLIDLMLAVAAKNGVDFYLGRKLPRLLRDAGLEDVDARPILHFHPSGDPRRTIMLDLFDNFRDRIIAEDLIAEDAFGTLRDSLGRHMENPETSVYIGPYIQAWGRKPARGGTTTRTDGL